MGHAARTVVIIFSYCAIAIAIAPQSPGADCPATVEADAKSDKWAYQSRPARCEGRYGHLVGTMAELELRSLTAGFLNIEPTQSPTWTVSWSSGISGPVTVRASSLLYREFYRMDALVPSGMRSFVWPMDVLAGLALRRRNIGVVAFTEETLLGRQERIYLPILVATQMAGPQAASLLAEVVPTRELDELYVTIYALDEDKLTVVSPKRPLQLGFYPEHRAIKITVSVPDERRRLLVQLIGQEKSGGGIPASFWIANEPSK